MSAFAVVAYWVVLAAAWGGLRARGEGSPLRPSAPTVLVWCLVAVPSLIQLTIAPGWLAVGERESAAVLDGQVWRLLTAVVLQDGGWAGLLSNLVVLAVTLVLVRPVLPGWSVLWLFVAGGVLANVLTVLTFGQTGAGCSMATIALATCALVLAARGGQRPGSRGGVRGPGAVAPFVLVVLGGLVLLALQDQHGLAVVVGLVTGLIVAALAARRRSRRP